MEVDGAQLTTYKLARCTYNPSDTTTNYFNKSICYCITYTFVKIISCSFVLFDLFVCPKSFLFPWAVESSSLQFLALA